MESDELTKRLGKLIRELRTEQGFSQESFADACNLHRTYIGVIERGEKTMSISTAAKLANALGLSLWELFRTLDQREK